MKARVGIFGGSFDPIHRGHVQAAASFMKSRLIDELLILLTPDPPHKKSSHQAAYSHRLQMLKLAFQQKRNVRISTLENDLPVPSYTVKTIEYLQKRHPGTRFFLCLGEDGILHFHKWYQYQKILQQVPLLVAERPGFDSELVSDDILERTIFVEHAPYGVSSTEIREKAVFPDDFLPGSVAEYIRKNHLYNR